jgi:hypothetical protein
MAFFVDFRLGATETSGFWVVLASTAGAAVSAVLSGSARKPVSPQFQVLAQAIPRYPKDPPSARRSPMEQTPVTGSMRVNKQLRPVLSNGP